MQCPVVVLLLLLSGEAVYVEFLVLVLILVYWSCSWSWSCHRKYRNETALEAELEKHVSVTRLKLVVLCFSRQHCDSTFVNGAHQAQANVTTLYKTKPFFNEVIIFLFLLLLPVRTKESAFRENNAIG